jgi:hypothetical protein
MNRQLMFLSFSALDQERTRTQGRNCIRDDGIILWGTAFGAVTDIEIPILNTAQAVEVHGRTGELPCPVQRIGVTLLLSGCQRCRCYDGGQFRDWQPGRDLGRTPHAPTFSRDCWALAKAASDSTVKARTPFMVAMLRW